MNRVIFFIISLSFCLTTYAKDVKVGGFYYRILNETEVAVFGTEINDSVIRIPSEVSIQNRQFTVVEVANNRPEKFGKIWTHYKDQDWGGLSTRDIIIPSTVKKIAPCAFYGNSLRCIYLYGNIEYISNYAFCNCNIGSIIFPRHINYILGGAFENSNIGLLDFTNTEMSDFDMNFLAYMRNLQALGFPQKVEKIELDNWTINEFIKKIKSLQLSIDGNTIKNLRKQCNIIFTNVIGLKITNTKKIDFNVSEVFPELEWVYFPNPTKEIRESAFKPQGLRKGKLKEVYFNNNIEVIGNDAFRDNPNLKNIKLPQKLKSIGESAFYGCTALDSIEIPVSVTNIGTCAFWGTNLSYVKGLNSNITYGMYGSKSDNPSTPFMGTPFDKKFNEIQKSFSYLALGKVTKEIKQWQQKKEYETTTQWKQRVTADNQKNKVVEIMNQVQKEYIALYKPTTIKGALGVYDADYETYPVSIDGMNTIYAKIPFGDAAQFRANWNKITMKPTYGIVNDHIAVTNCTFYLANKSWGSAEKSKSDNTEHFSYNIPTIDININSNPIVADENSQTKIDLTIDRNIPQTTSLQANTFVIAIGNENYTLVPHVAFANNDMNIFSQYCQKTLGIPMQNIRKYKDATYGSILAALNDIKDISAAYNGEINVIFYYAGHGIPNEKDQTAYLLPTDADGKSTEICFPVSRLYKELGGLKAKSVVVFMDACFSGAQRGNGMLASARGVAIKTKEQKPEGKLVVFTAASGEETAYPYNEKAHGLFTYFLLKKLNETKGECSLGELSEYIKTNVRRQSIVTNRKSQTPTIIFSDSVKDEWMNYKLTK